MANTLNYAEQWQTELLDTIIQGTLCSPFIVSNVNWLDAKTFKFPLLNTTGYKNHNRNGGWNRGNVTKKDIPYSLYHDRDVEFLVDKADVDETKQVVTIQRISERFTETQAAPETDAEFFSKVAQEAIKAKLHVGYEAISWTVDNVYTRLKDIIKAGKLRVYRQRGSLIMYVRSDIMDLLERSKEFTRKIEMTQVADGGMGLETRITEMDGIPIMEVIDDERFYTHFDWEPEDGEGGFEPDMEKDARKLSVLVASTETVKHVPKISSIYFFAPGNHTEGDGYLYQNRAYSGTFVFPNGKDEKVDSIYACYDGETIV